MEPFYGFVVLCLDEPALQDIMPKLKKKLITYGLNGQADLQAVDIAHRQNTSTFTVVHEGKDLGHVTLQIPGKHNVQNALAAIAVALELKVPFEKTKIRGGEVHGRLSAVGGQGGSERHYNC